MSFDMTRHHLIYLSRNAMKKIEMDKAKPYDAKKAERQAKKNLRKQSLFV